jgi:hypothetical protein
VALQALADIDTAQTLLAALRTEISRLERHTDGHPTPFDLPESERLLGRLDTLIRVLSARYRRRPTTQS